MESGQTVHFIKQNVGMLCVLFYTKKHRFRSREFVQSVHLEKRGICCLGCM